MKSISLTGVQRQTHAQSRDAVETLRRSPEQGFEKQERMGAVRQVPFDKGRNLPAASTQNIENMVGGSHQHGVRLDTRCNLNVRERLPLRVADNQRANFEAVSRMIMFLVLHESKAVRSSGNCRFKLAHWRN